MPWGRGASVSVSWLHVSLPNHRCLSFFTQFLPSCHLTFPWLFMNPSSCKDGPSDPPCVIVNTPLSFYRCGPEAQRDYMTCPKPHSTHSVNPKTGFLFPRPAVAPFTGTGPPTVEWIHLIPRKTQRESAKNEPREAALKPAWELYSPSEKMRKKWQPFCITGVTVKWCNHYETEDGDSSNSIIYKHLKQNYHTTEWSHFWVMYPKESKVGSQRESCTSVFLAAWFTIAKSQKQPKCLPMDEWISKMWSIHTVECYAALKRKEILYHMLQHARILRTLC